MELSVDITRVITFTLATIVGTAVVTSIVLIANEFVLAGNTVSRSSTRAKLTILRTHLFSLATVFGTLTLSIVTLEIVLRITIPIDNPPGYTQKHSTRGYILRPGYKGFSYEAPLNINSRGVRGPDRRVKSGDDTLRIVVLGDSMTYGIGVPIQDTYPLVLQNRLEARYNLPVQVFNLGVPSYNTTDELIYLKEVFDLYKPHIVILQYMVMNDAICKPRPTPQLGIRRTKLWQALREIPMRSYAIAWIDRQIKLIIHRVDAGNVGLTPTQALREDVGRRLAHEYSDSAPGWQEAQTSLKQIVDYLQDRDAHFIFTMNVSHIYLADDQRVILKPLVTQITKALQEIGITSILVLDDAFRDYAGRERELFVRSDDAHWNAIGHDLVANLILERLEQGALKALLPLPSR